MGARHGKKVRGVRLAPCGDNVTFRFTRHAGERYLDRWQRFATDAQIRHLLAYPNSRDDEPDPDEPHEKTHRYIRVEYQGRYIPIRAVLAWAPSAWPDGATAVPGSPEKIEISVITLMPTNP